MIQWVIFIATDFGEHEAKRPLIRPRWRLEWLRAPQAHRAIAKLPFGRLRFPFRRKPGCFFNLPHPIGDQEKSGARLDCFCFGIHGGSQRDSVSGKHSRPKSASPPSRPPVFPGLRDALEMHFLDFKFIDQIHHSFHAAPGAIHSGELCIVPW